MITFVKRIGVLLATGNSWKAWWSSTILRPRRSRSPWSGSLLTVDSTLRMIYDRRALTPLPRKATAAKEALLLLAFCAIKHIVDPIKTLFLPADIITDKLLYVLVYVLRVQNQYHMECSNNMHTLFAIKFDSIFFILAIVIFIFPVINFADSQLYMYFVHLREKQI